MATGEAFHRVSKEAKCELCCAKLLKFCCVLCRAGSVIPLTARIMPLGSSLADACISQCARVAHGPKPTLLPACFIDEWPHCKTEIPFHACHFFFFWHFTYLFHPYSETHQASLTLHHPISQIHPSSWPHSLLHLPGSHYFPPMSQSLTALLPSI